MTHFDALVLRFLLVGLPISPARDDNSFPKAVNESPYFRGTKKKVRENGTDSGSKAYNGFLVQKSYKWRDLSWKL